MRASGVHSKSHSETPLLLPRFPAHAKRVVQEFLHSQDLNKSISVLKEKKKSVVLLVVVMVAHFQVIISFKLSLVKGWEWKRLVRLVPRV